MIVSEIVKSPADSREYRGLVLENGMKVILVSDPETEKSGGSMDINVGYMKDPEDLMGLAHFCEHMLFLGTEKYPDENDYNKFIGTHGGSSNAFTSQDHTNYYFDVGSGFLEPALDRFSQFFFSPLFTESATDREVRAVHSEHEKNLQSDIWRISQLEKSLCDPSHDYHKFGTGNIQTLDVIPKSNGKSVREELLKFHAKWYSSDIMALSVLGSESLDELEAMVRAKFNGVKCKGVTPPVWNTHPFLENQPPYITYVIPVKDIRSLYITFPIPDLQPYYRTGPGRYIVNLIGHEGKGSILSELKARGWATSLCVGEKSGAKGFSFFTLTVDMTIEGLDHLDEVIALIFQYIAMLKVEGPRKMDFEEGKAINDMFFRFKDKEKPMSFVVRTSGQLHYYPLEEVLCGPYMMDQWKPELIEMVLNMLLPHKARITVISKNFEKNATESEKWYGTKYYREKVDPETVLKWSSSDNIHPNLQMPEKNKFIPSNLELVERDLNDTQFPVIVKESPMFRLWYKQDKEFLLPKANFKFELKSPVVNADPLRANLTSLFLTLLKDELNEYAYSAELAGSEYIIHSKKQGIFLSVYGFSEKLSELLRSIIEKMCNFTLDIKKFNVYKEEYIRSKKNFKMDQPHAHSKYANRIILSEKDWHNDELLEVVDEITVDAMNNFIPTIFAKTFVEGFIYGNVTKSVAISLLRIIEDHFPNAKPLPPSQLMKMVDREVILEENSFNVYKMTNEYHNSSGIETYYQVGPQDTRSNIMLELIAQITNEPCFNVLRTKEQLGYVVRLGLRRTAGVQGFRFIIRSDRHPEFLDLRIEAFLDTMLEYINKMDDIEFEQNKQALAGRRLEKPKHIDSKSSKFWREIVLRTYNFDRDIIETDELKNVTKEDLINFFIKYLAPSSQERRKLATYVISMTKDGVGQKKEIDMKCTVEDAAPSPSNMKPYSLIEDIISFKSGLGLYPQFKSFMDAKHFIVS